MKVKKSSGEYLTLYEGYWCSISVHLDGTGQVLLGFPGADGRQIMEAVTIPQVWAFLENVEALDREEFDDWVTDHVRPAQPQRNR
jgi:hypothetical protein